MAVQHHNPPQKSSPLPENVERIHRKIRARAGKLGMSLEAVSRKAGLDKTYLRKTFDRGGAPRSNTLHALAQALEVPESWFFSDDDVEPTASPLPGNDVAPANVDIPARQSMPADVEVLGTAAGSHAGGAFQLEPGVVVDRVRRPPALAASPNVYALYIEGDSMVPEHNPGDLRFIHPDRPPRIGDSVVVQMQNGPHESVAATIGHLHRRTATQIVIGKLNPEREIYIERNLVISVHKVLTMNELFGV